MKQLRRQRHQHKKCSKEVLSHTEAAHILADKRGFWVRTPNNAPTMMYAFVGKASQGKLVYIEFLIGAGDHYAVYYMRPANAEETEFYYSENNIYGDTL
ncbi:MAG: hypothetical protein RML40_07590 [Bacteroidota bacterium]|nr:hypothetical protein [Candidatus Kapabacteria bacterium]MDW8220377.1 hypothetical protein [Bacteroidota bacterium]